MYVLYDMYVRTYVCIYVFTYTHYKVRAYMFNKIAL